MSQSALRRDPRGNVGHVVCMDARIKSGHDNWDGREREMGRACGRHLNDDEYWLSRHPISPINSPPDFVDGARSTLR